MRNTNPSSRVCKIQGTKGDYHLIRRGPKTSRVAPFDLDACQSVGPEFKVATSQLQEIRTRDVARLNDTMQKAFAYANIRLPADLVTDIDNIASALGMSRTDAIRRLVANWRQGHGPSLGGNATS